MSALPSHPSRRNTAAPEIVVAGAGALGLATALLLARRGAKVTVCDPAPPLDTASAVAAGMLAPAFESVLDPLSAGHLPLLRAALDLWPEFAASVGVQLEREGALWAGPGAADLVARLRAAGASAELLTAGQARALAPGLAIDGAAAFTPDDWRLDAPEAIGRLRQAASEAGVLFRATAVRSFRPGSAHLADGAVMAADRLVAAVGAGGVELAPELASLTPVKGHILRMEGGPARGPVVRKDGVYVRPHPGGAWVGATMEVGRADRMVDPATASLLQARAATLFPDLASAPRQAATGVRATTNDGLPLVGWSATPGVLLAAGARRNGWLLAPAVAAIMTAMAFDEQPSALSAAFDPRRAP